MTLVMSLEAIKVRLENLPIGRKSLRNYIAGLFFSTE